MTRFDEMRDRLSRYLNGAYSLDEFQEWFAPALRDAVMANDSDAGSLACSIVVEFSHHGNGTYSSDQLTEALSRLAAQPAPSPVLPGPRSATQMAVR